MLKRKRQKAQTELLVPLPHGWRRVPVTELMMVRDVVLVLRVSRAMVLKLANAGKLPPVVRLPNGTRLFRKPDVLKLARERNRAAATRSTVKSKR